MWPSLLFDLAADPGQLTNVIDAHPDVAERVHEALLAFMRQMGAPEGRIAKFLRI
ncbi:MAG TPA: hypothetical protein GX714_10550 [Chloroflexi bacterium]|nr:hypothetical protein [Chloroflexota bacterium]